jgi:hypothetical protein
MKLETAQKLKDAGLPWMPELLDTYVFTKFEESGELSVCIPKTYENVNNLNGLLLIDAEDETGLLWLPRLDQLLEEIEARGYTWSLEKENAEYVHGKYCFSICNTNGHKPKWNDFHADSPEEAAAAALLWILEQERTRRDEPMG